MRLSISQQLELQERDLEAFHRLRETDPEKAKQEAIARLKRIGVLDENGNVTYEAEEAFGFDEVSDSDEA